MVSGIGKKILVISGGDPTNNSPKILVDIVESLNLAGNDTHLLLKYPFKHSSIKTFFLHNKFERINHKVLTLLSRIIFKIARILKLKKHTTEINKFYFFPFKEDVAPIDLRFFKKSITNDYDLFIIFFWQGIVNSKTIEELYEYYNLPIILLAADMYPMTGGCSYFWECRNFEKGCTSCVALDNLEFRQNVQFAFQLKKNRLKNINHAFASNSWVLENAKKTKLFNQLNLIYPPINNRLYRPLDRFRLRVSKSLNEKFVIFAGSVSISEERKGFKYLKETINLLLSANPNLSNRIVLVIAGLLDDATIFESQIPDCDVRFVGYLNDEELVEYYNVADIFLSPTIQDGGPLMVNQSLMCGTPVVAFKIGVAIDLVNSETGYLANYLDVSDMVNGISKILNLGDSLYENMRTNCRKTALKYSSYEAFSKSISEIVYQMGK
jgi:glycosyltransferase involved in cell wall biosynthesis